jgi:hypothetical protein
MTQAMIIRNVLIVFCLISAALPAQDSTGMAEGRKYSISYGAGIGFGDYLGDNYIEPTYYTYPIYDFSSHQYERFTKKPSYCLKGGALISRRISNRLSLSGGLFYYLRRVIMEADYDVIRAYNAIKNPYSPYHIRNVVKYEFTYHNLELPFLIQYKKDRLAWFTGVYFPVVAYRHATYTYLAEPNTYGTDETIQKTVNRFELPLTVYPMLKLSYDLKINNLPLSPFAEVNFGLHKEYYILAGIIIQRPDFK